MTTSAAGDLEVAGGSADPTDDTYVGRGFFWWGAGAYLVTMGALIVEAVRTAEGSIVFPLDDTAIHMAIARNLAEHGTWGVEPGHFQSASSSPLWTVLLATFAFAVPSMLVAIPWILNVAASLWAIAVLGADQRALTPGRRHPLDGPAVAILVVVVLLLPAVSMLGMEHTLHGALALSALVLFRRACAGRALGWPSWMPYLLLALATMARLETAFLAAGIVVATLSQPLWQVRPASGRRLLPDRAVIVRAVLIAASSLVPFAMVACLTRIMGQGWLPNSVLAKSTAIGGTGPEQLDIVERFTTDRVLALVTVLMLVAIAVGWRRRNFVFPAIAVTVTVALHVAFASVGWYDRYQAYLILLAAYVLLRMGTELAPVDADGSTMRRNVAVVALMVVALVVGWQKVLLTADVDRAVADTYEQRYQAGRFLARYYDGRPVATGELGYIALDHGGPVTDFYGLGDFEVLEIRRAEDQRPGPEVWSRLAGERGFDVAAVYPLTLWTDTPSEWILVGTWTLGHDPITAFEREFQFWATRPEEVAPLQQYLRDFESELPGGSTLHLDEFATQRAEEMLSG